MYFFGEYLVLAVFLDTETNGLDHTVHNILEIAFEIVDLSNGKVLESYEHLIKLSEEDWVKSNLYSLSFNGITKEKMLTGSPESVVAKEVKNIFNRHSIVKGKAVFICQNPSFDRIFFSKLIDITYQEQNQYPYHWLDLASMHFAKSILQGIQPDQINLSKDQIASYYGLEKEARPHRALAGVQNLITCYKHVLGFPKNPI
jgi:DNA polymerase-3 subunit epsilon/oligoribonuclease